MDSQTENREKGAEEEAKEEQKQEKVGTTRCTRGAVNSLQEQITAKILDFGDVIYKIASNTLLSKLDAVYHSAIRFVTKAPYTTHHCDLYALVGSPSLHICRQTHWLQVIYKSMLGKAPPSQFTGHDGNTHP